MTKLSIITICLNEVANIERTLISIVNQTFQDFEWIIVDGGSTDGTLNIIEKYRSRINTLISEKDSGIYDAMNKGIKKSMGEYCFFLNSSDYLYDKYVLENVFLPNPSQDIVYGNIVIDLGKSQEIRSSPEKITIKHLLRDTLWHPVSFIKRELFDKVGYYDTLFQIVGDYDFFLKAIITHNCSQQHINNIISVFNTQGISFKREFSDLLKKERDLAQIRNLGYNVIYLYNDLNKEIQELKDSIYLLQDLNKKILNSKTYKILNFIKKVFLTTFNLKS